MGEKKARLGTRVGQRAARDAPSFLLVQLVAHALAELLELALRFCIVGVDHEVLQMP